MNVYQEGERYELYVGRGARKLPAISADLSPKDGENIPP